MYMSFIFLSEIRNEFENKQSSPQNNYINSCFQSSSGNEKSYSLAAACSVRLLCSNKGIDGGTTREIVGSTELKQSFRKKFAKLFIK